MAPPTVTGDGLAEVTVMVWLDLTPIDSWTWGAAAKVVLPAWLKSMRQVPAAVKLTTPLEMVQPVLDASRVIATVPPGAVALGV